MEIILNLYLYKKLLNKENSLYIINLKFVKTPQFIKNSHSRLLWLF